MADPVSSDQAAGRGDPADAVARERARRVAAVILSHRLASIVGIALAAFVVLAFVKTVAFHALLMRHGDSPARLMAIAAEPPFFPGIQPNVRMALLLVLAAVFVTRSARLFRQEAEGLVRRLTRPFKAFERGDYGAFAIEAVLTLFAVGVSFTRFDYATAIITTSLAALVLWQLATAAPARSAGAFLLEITSSLGALVGATLVGWRCASIWLSSASTSSPFGQIYRQREAFSLWYKDGPLLLVVLLLAGLYIGYLEHGFGSAAALVRQAARRRFPWILALVVVAAVTAVALDLAYISSAEFESRCRMLASQSGQAAQMLCDALRVHTTQFVQQRDVMLLLAGVVVVALLYGVLCYCASLVLTPNGSPEAGRDLLG